MLCIQQDDDEAAIWARTPSAGNRDRARAHVLATSTRMVAALKVAFVQSTRRRKSQLNWSRNDEYAHKVISAAIDEVALARAYRSSTSTRAAEYAEPNPNGEHQPICGGPGVTR
jgi:excinuclease UvrABC helicase subunit UvrB